jgi:hypothetical protein
MGSPPIAQRTEPAALPALAHAANGVISELVLSLRQGMRTPAARQQDTRPSSVAGGRGRRCRRLPYSSNQQPSRTPACTTSEWLVVVTLAEAARRVDRRRQLTRAAGGSRRRANLATGAQSTPRGAGLSRSRRWLRSAPASAGAVLEGRCAGAIAPRAGRAAWAIGRWFWTLPTRLDTKTTAVAAPRPSRSADRLDVRPGSARPERRT